MPKSLKLQSELGTSHKDLLTDIKGHLLAVKNNTSSLQLNTDTLEAKIQSTNDKLDSFSGHTNNTGAIGDGSTQLRTVGLGYDRANGKAVSFLVDSLGHQQVDLVSGGDIKTTLDSLSGAGNNNVGEGQTKLQIFNYGRDTTAGNYKPMKVNGDGRQEVLVAVSSNYGGNGNLLNNEAMNASTTSNIADVSAFNKGNLLYEDATTSSSDTVDVEGSGNGAKYYKIATLSPALRGSIREGVSVLDLHGITHLRLKNSSSTGFTSITASIYGSN